MQTVAGLTSLGGASGGDGGQLTMRVEGLTKVYRIGRRLRRFNLNRRSAPQGKPVKPPRQILALDDVSFDATAGSIVGVIGPNGAGKSTLLKILGGVTLPTVGRAALRGRVVPLLELGSGFQADATGRENIYLSGAFLGLPRSVIDGRLDAIVEFAGLERHIDITVNRYSSGQYLRLAFAAAINMDPDILLADEILAVGDIKFQELCLQRVREAGDEGMTVLLVSHDMATVRRLCSRVIWLNAGRIVADGDADEVVSRYEETSWTLVADEAPEGAHSNRFGEIVETRLLSTEGSEIGSVRVSEEVVLRTVLRLKEPNLAFRCIQVFSTEGIDAFRTVQPQIMQAGEPGLYVADVRIPPNLMADVVYTVKTGVWIIRHGVEDREDALVRTNAISFRVYDTDESNSARGTYGGPLRGALRPKLDWETSRLPPRDSFDVDEPLMDV